MKFDKAIERILNESNDKSHLQDFRFEELRKKYPSFDKLAFTNSDVEQVDAFFDMFDSEKHDWIFINGVVNYDSDMDIDDQMEEIELKADKLGFMLYKSNNDYKSFNMIFIKDGTGKVVTRL